MIYTSAIKDQILLFLQDAFSQADFYDGINEYQWSEDATLTKVMISDAYTENLAGVDKRPAIIVNRGSLRWMNTSIDQRELIDFRTGRERYKDLINAEMTVNCFSRNGLEAEKLAHLVFASLQFFAREIRKNGTFEINSLVIGPESLVQADSVTDLSVVPVAAGIYMQDNWEKTFNAPVMRSATITLNGHGQDIKQVTDP